MDNSFLLSSPTQKALSCEEGISAKLPGLYHLSFACGQEVDRSSLKLSPLGDRHQGALLLFFGGERREKKWEACSCRITKPFQILCKLPSRDLSLFTKICTYSVLRGKAFHARFGRPSSDQEQAATGWRHQTRSASVARRSSLLSSETFRPPLPRARVKLPSGRGSSRLIRSKRTTGGSSHTA